MMSLKNILIDLYQDRISLKTFIICFVIVFGLGSSNTLCAWGKKKTQSDNEQPQKEEKVDKGFLDKVEDMRQEIFGKSGLSCKVVSKSFNSSLTQYDPRLEALVKGVIEDLKTRNISSLVKKFHPRLKVTKYHVKTKIFGTLSSFIFTNPSYSLYRVWALDAKDHQGFSIACDDEYSMNLHYGYNLQFGVWIQIMSDVELGWIYTTIVPYQSGWVLASFDVRQLSSEEKQAQDWQKEAVADYDKKLINLSYLKFDIARKLSYTGGYVYVKNLDKIKQDIQQRFSDKNPLMDLIGPMMEGRTLLRAESNFAPGGAGVFIRYGVTWKESDNNLNSQCKRIAKNILAISELSSMKGVKCSFSLPGEDLNIDGARGSLYIPRETQTKKK